MLNWLEPIVASVPFATLLAGLYSVAVYILLISTTSFEGWFASYGFAGHLATYVVILFSFGYMKHDIGYYMTVESNYCKQTQVCRDYAQQQKIGYSPESWLNAAKHTFGFLQNIWLEAIGEGILFVIIGLPVFWLVRPQWVAAFLVGALAHLASSYSGFHTNFCKSTCDAVPTFSHISM